MNEFPRYGLYLDALAIRDQAYAQIILNALLVVGVLAIIQSLWPRRYRRYWYGVPLAFALLSIVAISTTL